MVLESPPMELPLALDCLETGFSISLIFGLSHFLSSTWSRFFVSTFRELSLLPTIDWSTSAEVLCSASTSAEIESSRLATMSMSSIILSISSWLSYSSSCMASSSINSSSSFCSMTTILLFIWANSSPFTSSDLASLALLASSNLILVLKPSKSE